MRSFLLAAALCLTVAPAFAKTEHFRATLSGNQQVPPVQTQGHGTTEATLNTRTHKLDYTVTYDGLSGPAVAAHIHGPAKPGQNAGVIVPLGNPASPIKGSATLSPAQMKMLEEGETYVNVHTAQNKAGEIRGQLRPAE